MMLMTFSWLFLLLIHFVVSQQADIDYGNMLNVSNVTSEPPTTSQTTETTFYTTNVPTQDQLNAVQPTKPPTTSPITHIPTTRPTLIPTATPTSIPTLEKEDTVETIKSFTKTDIFIFVLIGLGIFLCLFVLICVLKRRKKQKHNKTQNKLFENVVGHIIVNSANDDINDGNDTIMMTPTITPKQPEPQSPNSTVNLLSTPMPQKTNLISNLSNDSVDDHDSIMEIDAVTAGGPTATPMGYDHEEDEDEEEGTDEDENENDDVDDDDDNVTPMIGKETMGIQPDEFIINEEHETNDGHTPPPPDPPINVNEHNSHLRYQASEGIVRGNIANIVISMKTPQ